MPRRLLSLCWPPGAAPDLAAAALWAQKFSPLTAPDAPDGILLDITGCAHLFGGEAGLRAGLLAHWPAARCAVAGTAAAAWALARYAAPGDRRGDEALDDLPLAALRLEDRVIIKLRRVGIRRIGQLAALPRAELTAGYGQAPGRRLAQALGGAPEVFKAITPPPEWRMVEHYAEPICAAAQLTAALARLAAGLCAHLATAARGATELAAHFYRVDGVRPEFTLCFAAPCRDEFQIARLAREKLNDIDPGFGVETLILAAVATEPLAPVQRGIEGEAPDFSAPVNTLLNRLGDRRLWRVAPHGTHIPEYATRRAPVQMPVPWGKPRHPRPLTLLRRPAPITAIAPVPDDPPVACTWNRHTHRVVHATGPERIARDWWAHAPDVSRHESEKLRDYYAVEDATGARFWLFRAGIHGGAVPPSWYLHGIFG
jgi:protein ImuB